MSKTDTGGPAFPQSHESWLTEVTKREGYLHDPVPYGLTILDYFAVQALAGLLGSPMALESLDNVAKETDTTTLSAAAGVAYGYAQAMVLEKRRLEEE